MQKQSVITPSVIGPDGRRMTVNDLPVQGTVRWVKRRKAEVVAAVRGGLLTLDDACKRWSLTEEELASWQRLYDRGGQNDLRATRIGEILKEDRRLSGSNRTN